MKNLTSGRPYLSRDEGTTMTVEKRTLTQPFIGRVVAIPPPEGGLFRFDLRKAKPGLRLTEEGRLVARVFVSSNLREFENERKEVVIAVQENGGEPVAWEFLPPAARPPMDRLESLVETCNIYVGLAGDVYSEPTIREYDVARSSGLGILVYLHDGAHPADPRQVGFLNRLKREVSYGRFVGPSDLRARLRVDLQKSLDSLFEDS